MIQAGAPVSYDHQVDEGQPQDTWTDLIRRGVQAFAGSVGESTRQLTAAAEKFASESLRAIDEAGARATASAEESREMAGAASLAAEEARQVAGTVRDALAEAVDQTRNDVLANLSRAEAAIQASEQLKAELAAKAEEAISRIEESLRAHEQFAARIEQAKQTTEENLRAGEVLKTDIQNRIEELYTRIEESLAAGHEAAASAQQAADVARQAAQPASNEAERRPGGMLEPSFSVAAQEVLERLEADYGLLARLVQELNSRIGTLNTFRHSRADLPAMGSASADPAVDAAPIAFAAEDEHEQQATRELMPHDIAEPQGLTSWYQREPEQMPSTVTASDAVQEPAAAKADDGPEHGSGSPDSMTPPAPASPSEVTISGRLLVTLSPVPDFDRLLGLDGALGRMEGVHNVTLADYAKEEVTFRVEVGVPTTGTAFSHALATSSGVQVDLLSATEERLTLRLID